MDYLFAADVEILEELGRRFKVARIQASFTQHELSEYAGISRATVARLEADKNISLQNFVALLRLQSGKI